MTLLFRWAAAAAGVGIAAWLLPGIRVVGGVSTLFVVALIFGLVNALIRPLVKMLSCGLIVLTLGLFLLVINAAMLWLTSLLASSLGFGFEVRDFGSAVLGAIIISLATWTFSLLTRDSD